MRTTVTFILLFTSIHACAYAQEKVAATVNGSPVAERRVLKEFEEIPPDLAKGQEASVKRQLLDRVIDQELVQQEGRRLNIESDKEYQKQIEVVKLQVKANVLVERYINETLTDSVLRKQYAKMASEFTFPAVKARHILVATQSDALEIIKIVSPETFGDLAKTRSIGPSAGQGGLLGWFRRESMVPEFAEAAFSAPVGKVVQTPIQTSFGWHILLIDERNPKYVSPFEQVKPQVKAKLVPEVTASYLATLRKKASIVYKPPYDTQ